MLSAMNGITRTNSSTASARAEPLVLGAAEGDPPQLEGDDVGVVLRGARRDDQHEVEDLEDVDDQRHEHDEDHRPQSGIVTRRNTCHSPAPSTRAASWVSRGMAARPAAITTIEKPAQIHR